MRIVSHASPLIGLARVARLDLVESLYGAVDIPEAVWREVVVEGAGEPGAEADFRISDALYERVLREAGEAGS